MVVGPEVVVRTQTEKNQGTTSCREHSRNEGQSRGCLGPECVYVYVVCVCMHFLCMCVTDMLCTHADMYFVCVCPMYIYICICLIYMSIVLCAGLV